MSANRLTTINETADAGSVGESLHGSDSLHVITRTREAGGPPMNRLAAMKTADRRYQ